jgi:hypothetical protein
VLRVHVRTLWLEMLDGGIPTPLAGCGKTSETSYRPNVLSV